ncbi:prephenate dehydrogenase [Flavobacteriaceae bacterium]|jgi:prephenate dehydrogenase|nr:prephenate dehydrogenase [Flavobacteriaceae bacterium]CAI8396408.1 MAG: Prephenate dehydrogenase [uncultured Bacteroidetes bacterium]
MNIGVIGLGLIGGSFALAAKEHLEDVVLYGADQNQAHLEEAIESGIVDQSLSPELYPKMDVMILAIPVNAASLLILNILDQINDNALLFDAGSTKASICKIVSLHPKRNQFLATHPIAGTEFSGPSAAFADLYVNQTQILCEAQKTRPDLLEWAVQFFRLMKMNIEEMDPQAHDQHIAYVSHISHISSFMLGKTVMEKEQDERTIFDMAGSGFASTVRLAKSSPEMWTPIFEQNSVNILEVLNEYIANLKEFKKLLENKNWSAMHEQMQEINAIKTILEGIPEGKNNFKN